MGLINLNPTYEKVRIELNLMSVKDYSLFEGEIIVAEGTFAPNNSKFNANRIIKPQARHPIPEFSANELKEFSKNVENRAIQIMVASGPFT